MALEWQEEVMGVVGVAVLLSWGGISVALTLHWDCSLGWAVIGTRFGDLQGWGWTSL